MKVYKIILCSIILPFAIASCKQAPVEVSSVSLNTATVEMVEGDTYSLVATVLPSNAEYESISWASSNTSVASVNQGTVTALKEGKTTITASAGGKSATCSVTVSAKYIAVTSITLDMNELSLKVGSSDVLIATVKPDDATDKSVQWSSSDATVVKVDNGKVTALKSGTAIITAKAGSCSAECIITASIDTESITLDKSEMTLNVGETATLAASITPADATDQNITWTSSNTNVASVNNGTVKALKAGTAIITAECSGKEAECVVIVLVPTDSVTLDKTSLELPVGDSYTLTATVKPDNAADKNVIWSSSDQSVASVTNGKVIALKKGTATITAECSGKKAECEVTVTVPVSGISLDRSELSIAVGESTTLTATITPADATDKTVTWASSKPDIASVDKGTIKALKAGKAIITAECNGKKAECKVTVTVPITGISLDKSELTLAVGEVSTLKATVTPSDATDKSITWTSSNTSVATVKDGTITALKGGTTTIVAECSDKKAECEVTVIIPVTGISLDKTELSIEVEKTATLTATITPADATDKTITWTSSNPTVATVTEGKIAALKGGITMITAECSGKKAECKVTVTVPVTGIFLDKNELSIAVGETSTLKATVTPSNATDKSISWSSSDAGIVNVDDGIVTAFRIGTTTITATAGDKTAKCVVTVWENIDFQDNTVKKACVAKFDTNDDGEISYEEASAVTDLTGLFANYNDITSFDELVYFDNVSELPDGLFSYCNKLKSVSIPPSVTKFGDKCFYLCRSLTSIDIPSSVTILGEGCFRSCQSLNNINIPSSVIELGPECFCNCRSLSNIIIPSSITKLPNGCFLLCSSLVNINIPSTVTSLGDECFADCSSLTSINIPSTVTSLGDGCFGGCSSLTSIKIPSSVTSMGDRCFNHCPSLTSINIPSSVTLLGDECFFLCSSLTSINIPSSVTLLGDECFAYCSSLISINIPSSVIGELCFFKCTSLTSVNISSSVTKIGDRCFEHCTSLSSVNIPSSVTILGERCFWACTSLTSVTIPSSVTKLGYGCFYNCESLSSIDIPSSVTELPSNCFACCYSLSNVNIPLSVTELGESCFWACTSLASIELPSSVTKLGDKCFCRSYKLSVLRCYATSVPSVGDNVFGSTKYTSDDGYLYVPEESIDLYKNASQWGSWRHIQKL